MNNKRTDSLLAGLFFLIYTRLYLSYLELQDFSLQQAAKLRDILHEFKLQPILQKGGQDSSKSMHRLQEDTTNCKHAAGELPMKAAARKQNNVGKTVKVSIHYLRYKRKKYLEIITHKTLPFRETPQHLEHNELTSALKLNPGNHCSLLLVTAHY